jgi:hypothetical protein
MSPALPDASIRPRVCTAAPTRRLPLFRAAFAALSLAALPLRLPAQDEAGRAVEVDTALISDSTYRNGIAGEFTPAKGFDLVKTSRSSLNISF